MTKLFVNISGKMFISLEFSQRTPRVAETTVWEMLV
jgi:hypothetical protein